MKRTQISLMMIVVLILSSTTTNAGIFSRRGRQTACTNGSCSRPVAYQQQQTTQVQQVSYTYQATETVQYATSGGDAYGFTNWINSVRARVGLRPVGWSDNLASYAAVNSSRGFGHTYMGGTRRQNVGVGALSTVQAMWLQSGGHWDAIADPTITEVGLAYVNGVWTMNAR